MMDDPQFEEKEEKEVLKHDEKMADNDGLGSVTWALILIWSGLVFLASNLGWFDQLGLNVDRRWMFRSLEDWTSFGVWNLVALGSGAIVLLEVGIRLLVPKFRRHVGDSLIVAAVLIGIGLGGFFSWGILWPLILIAVGLNMLLSSLWRRRE